MKKTTGQHLIDAAKEALDVEQLAREAAEKWAEEKHPVNRAAAYHSFLAGHAHGQAERDRLRGALRYCRWAIDRTGDLSLADALLKIDKALSDAGEVGE